MCAPASSGGPGTQLSAARQTIRPIMGHLKVGPEENKRSGPRQPLGRELSCQALVGANDQPPGLPSLRCCVSFRGGRSKRRREQRASFSTSQPRSRLGLWGPDRKFTGLCPALHARSPGSTLLPYVSSSTEPDIPEHGPSVATKTKEEKKKKRKGEFQRGVCLTSTLIPEI